MNNRATPLTTTDLLSATHRQPNPTTSEQRSTSPAINTKIKVQVGTVLVSATEPVLSTQRVALRRAQVCDLYYDGPTKGLFVARGVGAGGQFPAGSAGGASACAGADAELVLRYGG